MPDTPFAPLLPAPCGGAAEGLEQVLVLAAYACQGLLQVLTHGATGRC